MFILYFHISLHIFTYLSRLLLNLGINIFDCVYSYQSFKSLIDINGEYTKICFVQLNWNMYCTGLILDYVHFKINLFFISINIYILLYVQLPAVNSFMGISGVHHRKNIYAVKLEL